MDKSIGETIDTSVDMQLGSLSGNDLLLHADDFDNLEFHSASDDEDFVVVDCKAPTQRSFSDPGSTNNSTTRIVPGTSRTLSEINTPSRDDSSKPIDTSYTVLIP